MLQHDNWLLSYITRKYCISDSDYFFSFFIEAFGLKAGAPIILDFWWIIVLRESLKQRISANTLNKQDYH